ncbi:hypothetical protein B8W67_17105 [Mycolicibacillus koreensis]|uniref:Serine/threonine protein kinase n=1 Tax=Mycolicibacillus koreensis TaxID=1069220 RepID=A0AA91PBX1_9MYCO|nr:hypothetical protein B8W67_17105 [Mycolicibacillus koreensis]
MPLANGAHFAGFTILHPLGSGGMGEVYLATQHRGMRPPAAQHRIYAGDTSPRRHHERSRGADDRAVHRRPR